MGNATLITSISNFGMYGLDLHLNQKAFRTMLNINIANENGKILNSSETSLVNGYISFHQITPGTIVRDVHKLILEKGTTPGLYSLEVGWFSANNSERLIVPNEMENNQKSQVVIGEVEIDR